MPQNNVTMFPPTNWQRQCAILERLLFETEMVSARQDETRLDALDAADAQIVKLQELVKQQAEAAVAHQTALTAAEAGAEANATAMRAIPALRRWRKALLLLVPVTAIGTMLATFLYHATIQAALLPYWP